VWPLLTLRTSTLALLSQGQVSSREAIYSTQYSCEKIPADWLAVWEAAAEPALHLPKANPFIPTDFQLLQARMLIWTGRLVIHCLSPSAVHASPPILYSRRTAGEHDYGRHHHE